MSELTLFGSRAKGTARPDSDWDVIWEKIAVPLDFSQKLYWFDISYQILKLVGGQAGIEKVKKQASQEFSIPDEACIDLFVRIPSGLALLEWDDHHECLAGWISGDPE